MGSPAPPWSRRLLSVSSYAPYVLMSLFAGALIDRLEKKRVMLICDLFAALTTLAVLALLRAGRLEIAHLYLLNALNGWMNTLQQPASDVAVSLLVPRERYQRASAMQALGSALRSVFAPVLCLGALRAGGAGSRDLLRPRHLRRRDRRAGHFRAHPGRAALRREGTGPARGARGIALSRRKPGRAAPDPVSVGHQPDRVDVQRGAAGAGDPGGRRRGAGHGQRLLRRGDAGGRRVRVAPRRAEEPRARDPERADAGHVDGEPHPRRGADAARLVPRRGARLGEHPGDERQSGRDPAPEHPDRHAGAGVRRAQRAAILHHPRGLSARRLAGGRHLHAADGQAGRWKPAGEAAGRARGQWARRFCSSASRWPARWSA